MAATPAADEPLVLNCAGAFQGRVSVGQDMQVRVLRERILAAAAAQTPDPILDVKLIVSGRNLTVCRAACGHARCMLAACFKACALLCSTYKSNLHYFCRIWTSR